MKHILIRFASVSIMAAMVTTQATAAPQTCLSKVEAQKLMEFVMPDLISAMAGQCKPHLGATSFLNTADGKAMADRYRVAGDSAWPQAKNALLKLVGNDPIVSALTDDVAKGLFTTGIVLGLTEKIKPDNCSGINEIAEALAPLPPQNAAMLVGTILEMTGKDSARKGKRPDLAICPTVVAEK